MARIIWTFHFLVIIFLTIESRGEEIRNEQFSTHDKGFRGDTDASGIHSNMERVTKWQLNISACNLATEEYSGLIYTFNFEDQQLTNWISADEWLISTDKRINGNFSLKHSPNATSGESAIFYPAKLNLHASDYQWNFTLKNGNWEPSSSNRFWYYLLSDSPSQESLNGWAIGVNISGSDDLLELWRFRNGMPDSLIIESNISWKANTQYCIKVERKEPGEWSISSNDWPNTNNSSFSGTDYSESDFNYFGLYFDFTSTRAGKLWIDDISLYESPHPLIVQKLTVLNESQLKVIFNKDIEPSSIQSQDFQITSNSGKQFQIIGSAPIPGSNKEVILTIANLDKYNLHLSVSGISDKTGQEMQSDILNFVWMPPCNEHSVIINEILADPYPSVKLPEIEYIEIFNRSKFPVSLSELVLKVDEKEYSLEPDTLLPESYLVLTEKEGSEQFEWATGLSKFPVLPNKGTTISLVTISGLLVDQITYSSNWYANNEKQNGGWSLERIDPERLCGQANNWLVSENTNGGTPGKENSVKGINTDKTAPEVTHLSVASANQLDIYFSEQIAFECISIPENFTLKISNANPDSVNIVSQNQISLYFSQQFESKNIYQLEIDELTDPCGNTSTNQIYDFTYFEPEEYSLIITEVYADPYPSLEMPEYEYIELFNRAEYPVQLNAIQLQIETKTYDLNNKSIEPGEYLILCSEEGASLIPNSIAVSSFPSLRNGQGNIRILYKSKTIDQLSYSDNWYNDKEKSEGGWSLERIDNNRFCGDAGNWTASNAEKGGTPGEKNSVYANNQDNEKPKILDLEVISSNSLKIIFSENIERSSLEGTNNFTITPEIGTPSEIEVSDEKTVLLFFTENFEVNRNYSLQISGLSDECGNTIESGEKNFKIQMLKESDLLISEVLFNPYPGGTDFVEIYNNSEEPINLKNLYLANRNEQSELRDIDPISSKNRWIQPGEYVLCTADSLAVSLVYYSKCPECFIETAKFPSYPDKQGTVVILSDSLQVIDEFQYSEKMHHALIDDCEGVSLERLSFDAPTDLASNWHSAASSVGFATPGYANSQYREEIAINENIVVDPEVFSPNNDGYNDRLLIHYELEKPGYSANVKVYDSQGRLINHLVKNEIVSQKGDWFWDGIKADNSRPSLGIYILLVELFDMEGNVKKFRKTCTLTDRL